MDLIRVTKLIEQAFPETPLPDMSLKQAQLLDQTMDREISEEEWEEVGKGDLQTVWTSVTTDVLISCDAALSHISDTGFVYYIGAYMRLALKQLEASRDPPWQVYGSTVSHLCSDSGYSRSRHILLSGPQIDAVVEFLKLACADGGFEGKMAEGALTTYWLTPGARRGSLIILP